jgi:hypothetical protein
MMNTQKIMRLADIYAERCNDHQRHATEETHHDMMLFRNALEAEATRLHSVNAELLEALEWIVQYYRIEKSPNHMVSDYAKTAIAKAQE